MHALHSMETKLKKSNQKWNKAQISSYTCCSPVCKQIHDEPVFGVDVSHQTEYFQQIHKVFLNNANNYTI